MVFLCRTKSSKRQAHQVIYTGSRTLQTLRKNLFFSALYKYNLKYQLYSEKSKANQLIFRYFSSFAHILKSIIL